MKCIKPINIDISKVNNVTVQTVQYDHNSRVLQITITNDGVPVNVTGHNVIISGTKPDGNAIFNSCTVKDGKIEVTLTEQMNAVEGLFPCEIKLYGSDGSLLSAKPFNFYVSKSSTSKNVISSSEFTALTEALGIVQTIDNKPNKDHIWAMVNMGQDVKEAMTGGSVAVVGENTVLTNNIVDGQVTKSKTTFIKELDQYVVLGNEMMEEQDNCYYASGIYDIIENVAYKIINIYAENEDIRLYLNNIYRIYDFKGLPSNKDMVNHVGGGDNAGEQFYTLKKGHTLGLTISKGVELKKEIKYAPYCSIDGLKVQASNVENLIVGKEDVDFIEEVILNLFDGNYYSNYYLTDNPGSGEIYRLIHSSSYKSIIIPVEPNTEYTIIKEETPEEAGYYYFKIGTFTLNKEELLTHSSYPVDGAVRYAKTNGSLSKYKFTTGNTDKTLMIVVSKEYEPYLEVLKGNYDSFQSDGYGELYFLKGLEVYSKGEINKKIDELLAGVSMNTLKKQGSVINILFNNKVGYTLQNRITESINLNTWMLTQGTVNGETIWSGSDIEAPIKEKGSVDFIGGVHGDELYETVAIVCDGVLLDINTDYDLTFKNLTVFVKSILNRCETDVPVFTRYKKLEFVDDELIVSNKLICLVDGFLVERHTGCGLYSIYKDLLLGYSVNSKPELIPGGSTSSDVNMDEGTFYGRGFTATLKTLSGKHETYKGQVSDFDHESRPRYKLYFDCINSSTGVELNTGDELNTSFSIKII